MTFSHPLLAMINSVGVTATWRKVTEQIDSNTGAKTGETYVDTQIKVLLKQIDYRGQLKGSEMQMTESGIVRQSDLACYCSAEYDINVNDYIIIQKSEKWYKEGTYVVREIEYLRRPIDYKVFAQRLLLTPRVR